MYDEDLFVAHKRRFRRAQTLEYIEKNAVLKEAFTLEPQLYEVVHQINSILSLKNREQAYTTYKAMCQELVGYNAAKPELRTERHYITMLEFISMLLSWVEEHYPESPPELDDEFDEDNKQRSIDESVKQSVAISRENSLQTFKSITEQQK